MTEPLDPAASPPARASGWVMPAEPVSAAAAAPDDATAPMPAIRAYDLPSAGAVVSSGLLLAAAASRDLRRASLYIGLLLLGLFGPGIVYALALVGRFGIDAISTDLSNFADLGPQVGARLSVALLLLLGGWLGLVGVIVDGQLIAISLLAARAAGRAYSLRAAITRARQVFWRFAAASVVVVIAVAIVEYVVRLALNDPAGNNASVALLSTAVGIAPTLPFAYVATGIVIGDVGTAESLRRSIRLARARPSLALVVVLFTLVTSALQTFGLGAGLDIVARAADVVHLTPGSLGADLPLVAIVSLAFVVAIGSLVFTVAAIVAAPQVTAFLGLTFYSAGLDRAVAPDAQRHFHWVTRPMLALIIVLVLSALLALANLG